MSSCKKDGLVLGIKSRSIAKLYRGSDYSTVLQFSYQGSSDVLNLENFEGATGFFRKEDDSALAVTGTVDHAILGTLRFELTPEETIQLKPDDQADIEVHLALDGEVIIGQVLGKLAVVSSLY